jgi:hypothetical protein
MMKAICEQFPLSNSEWNELEEKFGDLAHYAAWQLLKMNAKNNHTDEIEDIAQELRWSIYRAGCYYKRQVYIESCLKAVLQHVKDPVILNIVRELEDLWKNRTRHGANRVKYGEFQQDLLEQIIDSHVPQEDRPDKTKALNIDTKFITYCKAITWNHKKSMGKKITREKSWRTGLVSLSEYDYMGQCG